MIDVVLCLTQQHDLRFVALALLICVTGSLATVQLSAGSGPRGVIAAMAGSYWARSGRAPWSGLPTSSP